MTRILFFGASRGYGAWDEEGGWVDRLKKFCHKRYIQGESEKFVLYNLGISGKSTTDMLKRFKSETEARLKDGQETIFIIEMGTNDSKFVNSKRIRETEPAEFRENVIRIIETAKKYSKKIVILGTTKVNQEMTDPTPWNTEHSFRNNDLEEYNGILREICKEMNLDFIDMFDSFDPKLLFKDGLHPGKEGHEKIYETVKKFLIEKEWI